MKKIIDFEKEFFLKKKWKILSTRTTNNERKYLPRKPEDFKKNTFLKKILKKFSIGTNLFSVLSKKINFQQII